MIRGPFTITVSEFAEKIDIDQLPEADREILAAGIHFDKTIHDA